MVQINEAGHYDAEHGIAVITLDSPPVNALSAAIRGAIVEGLYCARRDRDITAVVLICAGKTFIAGADIAELGKPPRPPRFEDMVGAIENSPKPVIAAIHGTALGGGLETALLCHYRVADPAARLGLPEVNLGLLPGGGGTQRLPRIVGVEAALDLIVTGRQIGAEEALRLAVIDAMTPAAGLRAGAIAFARQVVAENRPLTRIRDRDDKLAPARAAPGIFERFRASNAKLFHGWHAPARILEAVKGAVDLPFDEGITRERALINELLAGRQFAALRYIFFAEREAAKIKNLPKNISMPAIETVAILGAGPAAQEADRLFTNAGLTVNPPGKPDLVLAVGKEASAFAAGASPHASAPVMGLKISGRLMEFCSTPETAPETMAAAMLLGRRTGKIAVLCTRNFITARLAAVHEKALDMLTAEHVTKAEIAAMRFDFGFSDESGEPGPAVSESQKTHIREALLFPLVSEGAAMLADGTAQRASDIDIAAVAAFGWPPYTGGPMFWAATIGLPRIVSTLHALGGGIFKPDPLLIRLAETGQTFQSESASG